MLSLKRKEQTATEGNLLIPDFSGEPRDGSPALVRLYGSELAPSGCNRMKD